MKLRCFPAQRLSSLCTESRGLPAGQGAPEPAVAPLPGYATAHRLPKGYRHKKRWLRQPFEGSNGLSSLVLEPAVPAASTASTPYIWQPYISAKGSPAAAIAYAPAFYSSI